MIHFDLKTAKLSDLGHLNVFHLSCVLRLVLNSGGGCVGAKPSLSGFVRDLFCVCVCVQRGGGKLSLSFFYVFSPQPLSFVSCVCVCV